MRTRGHYPDLEGRAALVTGASSGIGRGAAEALLEEGARVAVHYNKNRAAAEALCARFPGRAFALSADLGDEDGCMCLAREATDALGGLDILVHSAGIWNSAPIERVSRPQLEEIFRVNVFSAFYLARELAGPLRASGRGSIVILGSTAGQRGEAGHAHYAASKGALQSFVMSLAVELAPSVRTNIVSPGWVTTPMADPELSEIGASLAATIPNRRVARVDDVTAAILYLASDASSHLLAQDLCVSGGALLVVPRGQIQPR